MILGSMSISKVKVMNYNFYHFRQQLKCKSIKIDIKTVLFLHNSPWNLGKGQGHVILGQNKHNVHSII